MKTASPTATRHRLLEGVLLRLAETPDAGGLVLRGGILLRHWFRPIPRPAGDLDLVSRAPFGVEDARRNFQPLFADTRAIDGVAYDAGRVRVEGICLDTGIPGVRIFASGRFGGGEADFHVDVTVGPPPRPAAVFGDLPTASGELARIWMCRPESVIGQKMQALAHLGMLCWRPKDLDDLRLILAHVPIEADDAGAAIGEAFAVLGRTGDDARAVFGPDSWWTMKRSSARWLDHVHVTRGREVPRDLAAVVAEVAARLAPILERVP